jgi:hypothetical protein
VKLFAAIATALVLAGAAGCTRAKAKTTPDAPALDVPPAPPRDVEVNESEPPPPMPLPQEPARNAPQRTTRNPSSAAPQQPARANEPPKTEPPKIDAAPAVEPPKAEEPPKPTAPTLQTTPAQADVEVERGIRATMTRATNDLNRIDYRVLNTDARTQYDTAKTFIRQADAALGRKNLEFARTLADKAAALAAQLRGR